MASCGTGTTHAFSGSTGYLAFFFLESKIKNEKKGDFDKLVFFRAQLKAQVERERERNSNETECIRFRCQQEPKCGEYKGPFLILDTPPLAEQLNFG